MLFCSKFKNTESRISFNNLQIKTFKSIRLNKNGLRGSLYTIDMNFPLTLTSKTNEELQLNSFIILKIYLSYTISKSIINYRISNDVCFSKTAVFI